jgi:hypothetical protein
VQLRASGCCGRSCPDKSTSSLFIRIPGAAVEVVVYVCVKLDVFLFIAFWSRYSCPVSACNSRSPALDFFNHQFSTSMWYQPLLAGKAGP